MLVVVVVVVVLAVLVVVVTVLDAFFAHFNLPQDYCRFSIAGLSEAPPASHVHSPAEWPLNVTCAAGHQATMLLQGVKNEL